LVVFIRSIRRGRRHKQFSSIRKSEISAVCSLLSIFRGISADNNLRPDRKGVLVKTAPEQSVRSTGFNFPGFRFALRIFDLDGNPTMWIDPFDLLDDALQ